MPIPPTNEQQRIVEAVQQLMILFDKLEGSVTRGGLCRSELLGAALNSALVNEPIVIP